MKKICYIVPYFGTLPKNFQLWLTSCSTNPTVDWLIFTDDKREFDYPKNVKVHYCSFDDIKCRLQKHFEFPIKVTSAWTLCLFRPAFGEIFAEELKGYDFWGHCDTDVLWGNIRNFITDEVLSKYDRIGFQGHSTFYRNNPEVNSRYKQEFEGLLSYKKIFSECIRYSFDENGMDDIYKKLGISYFDKTCFAHLRKYEYAFSLGHVPENEEYKNKCQIFEWNKGTLLRHYLCKGKLYTEEFMYVHFFCRPMKYLEEQHNADSRYIIYPDCVKDFDGVIDYNLVKKLGHNSAFSYYTKSIWHNRKKLTPKKIIFNIKRMIINKKKKRK